MLKTTKKYKAKPNLVSLIIIIIALPIVLNSFIRTPETVGDSIDPTRVLEICSEMFDSNSIESEMSENCDDRTHRSEHPIFGVSLIIHMIGGSMMMLSAIINFNSDILRKKRRLHRFSGYNFILGGIIAGSSAIIMTLFSPERFSSFNAFTNLLWGSLLLLYPLLAFRAIKSCSLRKIKPNNFIFTIYFGANLTFFTIDIKMLLKRAFFSIASRKILN